MTCKNAQHLQNGRFSIFRPKKKSANICSADFFFGQFFFVGLIFFRLSWGVRPMQTTPWEVRGAGAPPVRPDATNERTKRTHERMNVFRTCSERACSEHVPTERRSRWSKQRRGGRCRQNTWTWMSHPFCWTKGVSMKSVR